MTTPNQEHLFDRAVQLHQSGNFLEAESLYRQILDTNPKDADAMQMLGMLTFSRGRAPEALNLIRQAIAINPKAPDYHFHLGLIQAPTDPTQALESFDAALALEEHFPDAHLARGKLLQSIGNLPQAAAALRRAVELERNLPEAWEHLTDTLRELGRLDEAHAAAQIHIALRPDSPAPLTHLGVVLHYLGRYDEAISHFRRALQIDPNFADAEANLANALYSAWNIPEALVSYRKSVTFSPTTPRFGSNLLYALHFQGDLPPKEIFEEHLKWAAAHAQPKPNITHPNDRSSTRPLRIGYVSPDFRAHSVSFFIENLLTHHNPNHFEIFCYAETVHPDAVTEKLKSLAHHWRHIVGTGDNALANLIREDKIDILVDLAGHTANSRLLVFAQKPAPIQISYLGYPDTTGLSQIDYRFTDIHADPPESAADFYTEELAYLSPTFLSYHAPTESPEISPLPASKNGHITFGSLNHLPKINPRLIAAWSHILRQTPTSRLLIKSLSGLDFPATRQRILSLFASQGVDPTRVTLRPGTPSPVDHLKTYQEIDIALDTFPYNGTTTTCESLWMGVPVITLAGDRHSARVGVSLLNAAGLPDLIARDPNHYIQLATQLAGDLPRLTDLRSTLRDRMNRSPLLDGKQFAQTIEAVYRLIWRRWLRA